MTLKEIAEKLHLKNLTPELPDTREVSGGYASDLLSDVLANAPQGGILVTIQVHMNVIAVAVHAGLEGVIFVGERLPEEDVRQKAIEEGVSLFSALEPAFEIVGKLYALGLRGSDA